MIRQPAGSPAYPALNRPPLVRGAFAPLPLGGIRPAGWLEVQLGLQAERITVPITGVWKDLGEHNGWLGGAGESWERGPYYCDGLVPLAWLTGDRELVSRAERWMDRTLASARDNGWFGPETNRDWWPRMIMLKALTQYGEASGDPRVVPFLSNYILYQRRTLPQRPIDEWGRVRGADNILSVYWTYNRTGDERLLETADLIESQMSDWTTVLERFPFTRPMIEPFFDAFGHRDPSAENVGTIEKRLEFYHETHGVNMAMGLKAPAVFYLRDPDPRHLRAFRSGLASLLAHHGTAGGVFTGDEHLSGLNPAQGVETCTVAEYLFSLEQAAFITGDAGLWDLIERAAFNALPASMTADLSCHQYFQQDNQVRCSVERRPWYNGKPDSNIFGLEPNYGCCTSNLHQAWPKLASSLWGASYDCGAVMFSPLACETYVGLSSGGRLRLRVDGAYPFEERAVITVLEAPGYEIPLYLRIPGWCETPALRVNGSAVSLETCSPAPDGAVPERSGADPATGGRARFGMLRRAFVPGDRLELFLPAVIRERRFADGTVSLERGPLVMALPIAESWTPRPGAGTPRFPDWLVSPESGWNYALVPDSVSRAAFSGGPDVVRSEAADREPGDVQAGNGPVPAASPVSDGTAVRRGFDELARRIGVRVPAVPVEGWSESGGNAPVPSEKLLEAAAREPVRPARLVPYGAARLRISRFPIARNRNPENS